MDGDFRQPICVLWKLNTALPWNPALVAKRINIDKNTKFASETLLEEKLYAVFPHIVSIFTLAKLVKIAFLHSIIVAKS